MLDEEHAGFAAFKRKAMEYIEPLFANKDIRLSILYFSFREFLELLDLSKAHKALLRRYLV